MRNDSHGSSHDYGDVVFRCHFRRLFAIMFLLVGGVFSVMMLDTLFFHLVLPAKHGIGYQLLFGGILLIGLLIVWLGVLQIRRPVVFFEVTSLGIVNYQSPTGSVGEPCFLPWERVESVELVRRETRHADVGIRWSWFIKLVVAIDKDWPPDGFFGYEPKERAVFLDAFSGTPSGRKLLERVTAAFNASGS